MNSVPSVFNLLPSHSFNEMNDKLMTLSYLLSGDSIVKYMFFTHNGNNFSQN